MLRNILLFIGMFLAGAVVALATRAALHNPHSSQPAQTSAGGEYAPMVSNRLAPAEQKTETPATTPAPKPAAETAAPATDPHAGHGPSTSATPGAQKPVNTVCAICGMEVDPSLPTAQYQGKTIGFGCKMCPPKFKAAPDKYGPSYLKNEVYKG